MLEDDWKSVNPESVASTSDQEAHQVLKRKTDLDGETVEGNQDKQEEMRVKKQTQRNRKGGYIICVMLQGSEGEHGDLSEQRVENIVQQ